MSYYKNQKIELDITDMTKDGLGIAKIDSRVFFVKNAIIGDRVNAIITKVSNTIIYAKAVDIITKSDYRIESKCMISNSCGGCQLLNLNYKKQLEFKKRSVFTALNKIGKIETAYIDKCYDDIFGMDIPHRFRNKMQVPFAYKDGKIVYGFYASRTHHIVEFDYCISSFKGADIVLDIIKNALEKFKITIYDENTGEGVFREVMLRIGNVSHELSITYILNDKTIDKNLKLYEAFDSYIINRIIEKQIDMKVKYFEPVTSTINININNNNVLFGNSNLTLRGKGYIEDSISDIKYHISPESFYQVNMKLTNKLYDKVMEYADFTGQEKILDLYCGIGTISLYIARKVKSVIGVEIVKKAVENAKENAKLNNITNAEFICCDISKFSKERGDDLYNFRDIDTVIVDPPRKGIDKEAIEFILEINPKKIIYVSCDPATLARDLNSILCSKNEYKLEKIANVDMFSHTTHIETIVRISRGK